MNEQCFTPLSTIFQSYHGDSSLYSRLSWISQVLGRGSEVSCPRTLPRKALGIHSPFEDGGTISLTEGPFCQTKVGSIWLVV